MTDDLKLLAETALAAGDLALKLRDAGLTVERKEDRSPVTNGDLASNDLIKARLSAARPDYGWLSEETPDSAERLARSRTFVIDPIDGTSSYLKGHDYWSVCIAVVENGKPIAGVVYAPSLRELYQAAKGAGARMNGAPIHASNRFEIEGCKMLGDTRMLAHPSWPLPWPSMQIEARNSVAYRMALVAAGAFDACVAISRKHDWDLAAADIIVSEAGGVATDHKGQAYVYNRPLPQQASLVCAGPALHPLLLERVSHIEAPKPA